MAETASPSTPCWRSSSRTTTQATTKGQILLPSYDFFQQCAQVFEDEKRAFPTSITSNSPYSFEQAQTMVKTANRLRFPLLAGSSFPVTWRLPDVDIPLGAQVKKR